MLHTPSALRSVLLTLCASLLFTWPARSATVRVPQDQPSIQAGIDAAVDGDLVLVAPGTYFEEVVISGKTITLASEFHLTGDPDLIDQTTIHGSSGSVVSVTSSVGPDTQIIGFRIRNGNNGIDVRGPVHILHNHIIEQVDAIDYTNGGGTVRYNLLEHNTDDGVDVDRLVDAVIEDNIIRHNDGDGIEIRFNEYAGPVLDFVVRRNLISANENDGIQIIEHMDQTGPSDRFLLIERNIIRYNGQAAIGMMDNSDSGEDYRAASILEPVHVFNNVFVGHSHGISGGDNVVAVNNLFVGVTDIALKDVDGGSIVAYNGFWGNGSDNLGSNLDLPTTLLADPRLDADQELLPGSPAVDAGTAFFQWQGQTVLDLPAGSYSGGAPDLGHLEFDPGVGEVLELRVLSGGDDAAESSSGAMDLGAPILDLVGSDQAVGVRFDGVGIPRGAGIVEAFLQFQAHGTDDLGTTLEVAAEASGDAAAFGSGDGDLSSRPLSGARVGWSPERWVRVGEAALHQRTPDLSALVQEVVDRQDWVAGNALALILTGSGNRRAESFEGDAQGAPLLHVRYTRCGNGVVDPGEVCDGSELLGETCQSQGFTSGSLTCSADCSSFDTSACGLCISDLDEDGACDSVDNCPDTWNPGQEDADGDGVGDV
jgi:hypothetical protein